MEKNSIKKSKKEVVNEIFSFIAAWLEQAARSNSPHTVEAYKYAMDLYIRFLDESLHLKAGDFTWKCFSRENIEEWMKWLTGRGKGGAARLPSVSWRVPAADGALDLWSLRSSKNQRLSHIREYLRYMEGRSAAEYGHLYREAALIKRMKVQYTEVRGASPDAEAYRYPPRYTR